MTSFALLRSKSDLVRTCEELSVLLGYRVKQTPGSSSTGLLGLWIDPGLPGDRPLSMPLHEARSFQVRAVTNRSTVWTLYWLDIALSSSGDPGSRETLLANLLRASGQSTRKGSPDQLFIPVFGVEESGRVSREMSRLKAMHPSGVGFPVFQDVRAASSEVSIFRL